MAFFPRAADPAAVGRLLAGLDSADAAARGRAAFWLGITGGSDAEGKLLPALRKETDLAAFSQIAAALAAIGSPAAREEIAGMLSGAAKDKTRDPSKPEDAWVLLHASALFGDKEVNSKIPPGPRVASPPHGSGAFRVFGHAAALEPRGVRGAQDQHGVDHGQEEVTAAREAALASEPAAGPARFQQGIGLLDATTLVVGSMIGSGIFIVSAQSSRVVGSPGWLLMAWAIAGSPDDDGVALLRRARGDAPEGGRAVRLLPRGLRQLFGFLFGWTMFLVVQTGTIAAVSVAFAKFLGVLWPAISAEQQALSRSGVSRSAPVQAVALVVIAVLTASNATGLKAGTRIQNVFTFAKFAALFGLTALGLALGHSGSFAGGAPGFWKAVSQSGGELTGLALVAAVATAMVGPMFSQSAWNNVTFAGEEIRDPGWTLPRALLLGCLLVTTIYVLANVAYLNVLSFSEIQQAPEDRVATAAATSLFGPGAAAVMAAAIMVSTFGCVNGLILSGARVSFAMARDGFFFRGLQRLNSSAVPGNALWAQAFWSGVLVLSGSYTALFTYVISVDILFFVLLVLAVIVLRVKHPEWPRPFRAPLYPYLPLLYAAVGAALIVILLRGNPKTTWPGYAIVMSGIPIYFFWRRK